MNYAILLKTKLIHNTNVEFVIKWFVTLDALFKTKTQIQPMRCIEFMNMDVLTKLGRTIRAYFIVNKND